MSGRERGRLWRAGEYLGLVIDEPKPLLGSARWWHFVLLLAACVTVGLGVTQLL